MSFQILVNNYLDRLKSVIDSLEKDKVSNAIEAISKAVKDQNVIYVCGNGGSSLTASHLACDFNKGVGYGMDVPPNVVALTDNIGTMMAYANDLCFEDIFVEQIRNRIKKDDLLVSISGSGNSANVIKAVEYARSVGAINITFTGYSGGKLKELSDISCHANVDDMQIAEDIHMIFVHMFMQILCNKMHS